MVSVCQCATGHAFLLQAMLFCSHRAPAFFAATGQRAFLLPLAGLLPCGNMAFYATKHHAFSLSLSIKTFCYNLNSGLFCCHGAMCHFAASEHKACVLH